MAEDSKVTKGVRSTFVELTEEQPNPTGGVSELVNSTINWQNGIVEDGVQNGAFVEDVIQAAVERLQYFQNSKFNCRENSVAITKLEEALMWLDYRTKKRVSQGVENTYEVHDASQNGSPKT